MNQYNWQAGIRSLSATDLSFNGDWLALFDKAGIADGSFNERLWHWAEQQLGASYPSLADALSAVSQINGYASWGEITDIIAPSAISGLTAWWDCRSLAGLIDGALIDGLEDQKGSFDLSASGDARPTLRDGGNHPSGRPYLEFDGTGNYFSLAQKTALMPAFTLAWAAADDFVDEFNFLFADSDSADILGLRDQYGDKIYFRGNGVTSISDTFTHRRPSVMAVYVFVYDGADYRLYVNGALWKQASVATAFEFNLIAGRPQASQFWRGALGEMMLFDRALIDDERQMVETYLSPWQVTSIYVDNLTGDDENRGWSADQPWETLDKVNGYNTILPGDSVLFRRGRIWRGGLEAPASGTQAAPCQFGAYGEGSPPAIYGSIAHSSGWTQQTGTEFSKAMVAPINVFWLTDGRVEKLIYNDGQAGSLMVGQWDHDGTDLFINIGQTANGEQIEIPLSDGEGGGAGIAVLARSDFIISGFSVRFCLTNGIAFASSTRPIATDCEASYNGNDGFNIHTSSDFYLGRAVAHRNGQIRTTLGAAGDGFSAHEDCDGLIEDAVATNNEKGGFLHQRPVMVTHRRFFAKGNNRNLQIDGQGTPAVDGFTRWENGVVVRTGDDQRYAVDLIFPADIRHLTIIGDGEGAGLYATDKVTARNCVIAHMDVGISSALSTSADTGHMLFWANQQDLGSEVLEGVGTVRADPLFADEAAEDYRLRDGSPAIGAGVAGPLSDQLDASGNPIGSAGRVTIGAYQYPVRPSIA